MQRTVGVLYYGDTFDVVVKQTALEKNFNNHRLYAARFFNKDLILSHLRDFGQVLYVCKEQREAILRISDPQKADELAALLHEHSGIPACGSLIKLRNVKEALMPLSAKNTEAIVNTYRKTVKIATKDDSEIQRIVDLVEPGNIRQFVQELSTYKNRHHRSSYGTAAANHIYQTFHHFTQSHPNLSVQKFSHTESPQPSIIASLKGTTLPDEIVIIGCHIDSINKKDKDSHEQIAPGADDNASGTSSVKEALRVLATHGHKFKRTIEFHGYAAEEVGLIGSKEIAEKYKQQGKKVIGMIQIDMNLYVPQGAKPKINLVTDYTNAQHTELAYQLVRKYTELKSHKINLWFGVSDHLSWHNQGVPTVFPFEDSEKLNANIHTVNDTIAKSGNFILASNITKLALAYAVTLAELDE